MKIFSIYHAKEITNDRGVPVAIRGSFGHDATVFPDDYTHVADIEAEHIDEVYGLTQNRDLPWTTYIGCSVKVQNPLRSTSVMDLILTEDRRVWVVAPVGLSQIIYDGEGRVIIPSQYR